MTVERAREDLTRPSDDIAERRVKLAEAEARAAKIQAYLEMAAVYGGKNPRGALCAYLCQDNPFQNWGGKWGLREWPLPWTDR